MADTQYVMLTTSDADIHLVEESIEMARMKVERNRWIITVDRRYIKTDKVVSLWKPTEFELRNYMEGIGNE